MHISLVDFILPQMWLNISEIKLLISPNTATYIKIIGTLKKSGQTSLKLVVPLAVNCMVDGKHSHWLKISYYMSWNVYLDFIFSRLLMIIILYHTVYSVYSLSVDPCYKSLNLSKFQANFSDYWLMYLLWKCPVCLLMALADAKLDSGDGLVSSGNKPLPEPMLTELCEGIWHQSATIRELVFMH